MYLSSCVIWCVVWFLLFPPIIYINFQKILSKTFWHSSPRNELILHIAWCPKLIQKSVNCPCLLNLTFVYITPFAHETHVNIRELSCNQQSPALSCSLIPLLICNIQALIFLPVQNITVKLHLNLIYVYRNMLTFTSIWFGFKDYTILPTNHMLHKAGYICILSKDTKNTCDKK